MPRSPIPSRDPLLIVKMNLFMARPNVYRSTGGHPGIDIWSPLGDDWFMCVPGVVHFLIKWPWQYKGNINQGTSYSGYGAAVAIDWGQGDGSFIRVIYGHGQNRKWQKDNQNLGEGEYLMESGNTGFTTGPHMHFEMRHYPKNKTGKYWDGLLKRRYNLLDPIPNFFNKYKIKYLLA